MSWSVSYNSTRHLIKYVFEGKVLSSELELELELAKSKGISLSLKHNCYDFLIDATGQEQLESITPFYEHAESGYTEEGLDQHSRAAVILPKSPEMRKASRFYETVCRNRGWRVRSFEDREAAIEWLKPKAASNKPDSGDL